MILNIVKVPSTSLRDKSKDVPPDFLSSNDFFQLVKDMIITMRKDDGIGLAAPQINKNIRLCVIGKEADETLNKDIILINPSWEKINKKTKIEIEGCLSVPNQYGKVKRYKHIQVKALNEKGENISFEANNYFARVIQHEVDHLNGVLFIDKAKGIYTINENDKKPSISV